MSCEKSVLQSVWRWFSRPSLLTCSTVALPHCMGRLSWEPAGAVCPQEQASFLSSLGIGSNVLRKLAVGVEDLGVLAVGSADP